MDDLRLARAEDLPALTELCLRSKAHWGYDAAFLEACRDDLTILPPELETSEVWMLDGPLAVVQVTCDGATAQIGHLFLDPTLIGQGHGRSLFDFACGRVRALGASTAVLTSEPKAAGFYEALGGVFIGYEHSEIFEGRKLPRYQFVL